MSRVSELDLNGVPLQPQPMDAGGRGGGLTNALTSKIASGSYQAFINQVNAKCCAPARGKTFTAEQAALLIELAAELDG